MKWLDTVAARVMTLIVFATLPLAIIAGLLAWRSYETVADQNTRSAAILADRARGELEREADRNADLISVMSNLGINTASASDSFAFIQSISMHRYCLLGLLDASSHLVTSVRGTTSDGCPAGIDAVLPKTEQASGDGEIRREVVMFAGQPMLRVVLKTQYIADMTSRPNTGVLVTLRPLGWKNDALPSRDVRHLLLADLAGRSWLVAPDGVLTPLVLNQPASEKPSEIVVDTLGRSLRAGAPVARMMNGSINAAMVPVLGVRVLVQTARTESETHALHLFAWRVFLIGTFLAVELLLVAVAAHAYLVDPMQKLAKSVADWRRGGTFDPDLGTSIPYELRQLERAFRRATMRLGRHEARLVRAAQNQDHLIREIHHRVKNNLQVVASLLNLQASRIRSPETRSEFQLVRDRVRALATLHRYLYPETGMASLDIRAFLNELCYQLVAGANTADPGRISLDLDIDAVPISPDQAVPLSLIITEAVSNTLRYAYPAGINGEIRLRLTRRNGNILLIIADDGVGLESRVESETKREGIGLQLIRGFARQLNGTLEVEGIRGTRYVLNFPPQERGRSASGREKSSQT